MLENILVNLISNTITVGLVVWIGLKEIKRIDRHDEDVRRILEILAGTQKEIAILIERTKKI